ncbi:hypothetical protein [Acinetobacter baumannii]|uniref:hypothetical protein n=1 Tax=Acinetobacter baumannii TaxID=470 RepID=UPI000BD51294|nr:hypothetical protein [Acinetobacter baumannii]MBC6789980.1 hypothetical protein [Acinetobacter baumannii]MBS4735899.1 hypothetical protein [Acinetobacter baumannii]MCH1773985.1 hypothetical protein [Acinetobacter baumannii]MCM1587097.1 hypothetical protein [Acinetobacter baumannii]MCR0003867.1 hypothetical protein [Acinetobacter baumannii]
MNVSEIVTGAMKRAGILATGENASAQDLADGIDALKDLLAQWATDNLLVYKVEDLTLNLNGIFRVSPDPLDSPDLLAAISRIPQMGTLDNRPVEMVRDLNISADYPQVTYKVLGQLWEFSGKGLLSFKAFTMPFELRPHDELNIPPVYERALKLTLAVEICPMFGVEPLPSLQLKQTEAFNMLKNSNVTPLYVKNDLPVGVGVQYCYGEYY